jgi:hypothetical protein
MKPYNRIIVVMTLAIIIGFVALFTLTEKERRIHKKHPVITETVKGKAKPKRAR